MLVCTSDVVSIALCFCATETRPVFEQDNAGRGQDLHEITSCRLHLYGSNRDSRRILQDARPGRAMDRDDCQEHLPHFRQRFVYSATWDWPNDWQPKGPRGIVPVSWARKKPNTDGKDSKIQVEKGNPAVAYQSAWTAYVCNVGCSVQGARFKFV